MVNREGFCRAWCIAIALVLPHYALKIHGSRLGPSVAREKRRENVFASYIAGKLAFELNP